MTTARVIGSVGSALPAAVGVPWTRWRGDRRAQRRTRGLLADVETGTWVAVVRRGVSMSKPPNKLGVARLPSEDSGHPSASSAVIAVEPIGCRDALSGRQFALTRPITTYVHL
jgi:hypothetical protein